MKKYLLLSVVSGLCMSFAYADDAPAPQLAEQKQELRAPFHAMTTEDQEKTGIRKLTPKEQDALVSWWNLRKSIPTQDISQEFTIAEIQDGGKSITLNEGSKISFASSERKKTSKWVVGDTVGIMRTGRKGSLTLYHVASGQKVKGKREQAPQNKQ
jgi:hypothetical protein